MAAPTSTPSLNLSELSAAAEEKGDSTGQAAGEGSSMGGTDGAGGVKERVVVVGSGPAGLFAALSLAEAGVPVTLLERGKAVEERGRDIGALFVRRVLNEDSNLCYGEVRYICVTHALRASHSSRPPHCVRRRGGWRVIGWVCRGSGGGLEGFWRGSGGGSGGESVALK
eukprot:475358-Prorocentrum_minimum.AAC.5